MNFKYLIRVMLFGVCFVDFIQASSRRVDAKGPRQATAKNREEFIELLNRVGNEQLSAKERQRLSNLASREGISNSLTNHERALVSVGSADNVNNISLYDALYLGDYGIVRTLIQNPDYDVTLIDSSEYGLPVNQDRLDLIMSMRYNFLAKLITRAIDNDQQDLLSEIVTRIVSSAESIDHIERIERILESMVHDLAFIEMLENAAIERFGQRAQPKRNFAKELAKEIETSNRAKEHQAKMALEREARAKNNENLAKNAKIPKRN
ncbi:hypothetical protein KAZ82_00630 [Candidatus Babeliales bacterium]|nr:hypothetical protein [Candidatus Babeliales bacterium]